ncbi:protrudin isoform X2 [Protopterus annectens]|uniref:protrudin isoform X2 n=1 Tax=Protopterus annectens TaxID=7888 RepID=UPI001CFA34F5|nr:protrudin isoform X2 [Protopterus annectens]
MAPLCSNPGGSLPPTAVDFPVMDQSDSLQSSCCKSPTVSLDLLNLVLSYRRLEIFLEPITDCVEVIRYLIRWQSPKFSVAFYLVLNFLFLTLSEAAWFTLCTVFVSLPALLGCLQSRSQKPISEEDMMKRKYHSVRREDLKKVKLSRHEALVEVKTFLIQMDDTLTKACNTCEMVCKVLYWEDHSVSCLFYGGLLCSLSVLYLLPICWTFALLNSLLFLGNRDFYRVLTDFRNSVRHRFSAEPPKVEPDNTDSEGGTILDRTPTPTSLLEDLSPGSVEETEEMEVEDEFKDAIEEDDDEGPPCVIEYDPTLQDNGLSSRNEMIKSKVSRLTEKLRRRYPANNYGTCTSCSTTFSVLKKRRSCSNCGNIFCSRCCSYKVPKSYMGATAPDAQRETVFVCSQCYYVLSKKE